jgi:cytochrome d ubiquinol oxidase subunit II
MAWETLCILWFLLLGFLLCGYAVLDGFDLGIGILHPFVARTDDERRINMNAIGPLWDGNEVWLVTFGGALFAAFPAVYATAFSGFYTAFMLLLLALISRGVSMEFRSKLAAPRWRAFWDWSFFAGSTLATLLFGVAIGNAIRGQSLDAAGNFTGTLVDQLDAYPLLVGLFAVAMFAQHGALFLYLKTEDGYQERIRNFTWHTFGFFLVTYMLTTIFTLIHVPAARRSLEELPLSTAVVVLSVLAVANIPRCVYLRRPVEAFLSSGGAIAGFLLLFGLALFPNLVTASNDPELSVTVFSGASSARTLTLMLVIAAIGMPFVLGYTALVYWTFRGKVRLTESSY